MATKEQIEARRKRLKAEYGRLFDEVAAICFRHDPMYINFEVNSNEYEPEVGTILPRLKACESVDDAVTVVHEEFQNWFGADSAGPREEYRALTEEIWRAWNQRKL